MERVLLPSEKAYKSMNAVAKMLEAVSPNDYRYEVEDCYLDLGQDWKWTTIICHDPKGNGMFASWQILDPKEWREIFLAESVEDIIYIVNEIRNGKYFLD